MSKVRNLLFLLLGGIAVYFGFSWALAHPSAVLGAGALAFFGLLAIATGFLGALPKKLREDAGVETE